MKKKIKENDLLVYDQQTGEVIDTISEGDRIIHNTKRNNYMHFNKDKTFVKMYDTTPKILRNYLTPSEYIFTMSLIPYVSYEDCILVKNPHEKHCEFLDIKGLADELDMDYSVVRRITASLKRKGVIGKHSTGSIKIDTSETIAYTVNPYIFFRGIDVNESVVAFYKNSGWKEVLEDTDM